MGFDIMSLQKGRGTVQARSKADEGRAVLKYIDVEDLVPSEDNFYSMSAIDELAALIELSGGVKQPGLVVPLGGGKYKVISGHRRRLASLQLVKQGKEAYRKMPCMVEDAGKDVEQDAEAEELRAIDEAILIITTNGQREKTGKDKVEEATRLRELLERKRKFESIPGETRKIIAEWMGTTPAQVGRYDSIAKHLAAPFRRLFERGKINISVAYELSTLENGWQYSAYDEYLKKGGLSIEDVKRKKQEAERVEEIRRKAKDAAEEETSDAEQEELPDPPELPTVRTEETSPAPEQPGERDAGKIVNFPAPSSPPPAEDAPKPEKEPMHKRMAANILEDLQMYCEEMLGIETGLADTWAERADALAVAIDTLRR